MDLADDLPAGGTPIDPEDAVELVPAHITTREQLNEWEQANILAAERWAFSRKRPGLLSRSFLQNLHRHMFDKTWRWAGTLRRVDTNIGDHWRQIPVALHNVCEDAKTWLERETYSPVEAAARFHLRLVQVHPFPNGNGRHARLSADLLLHLLDLPRLSWGSGDLQRATDVRSDYLSALRSADQGNVEPLLKFVVS
ncbi:MAG: mobile mystery protein B [Gemmatimonadaceae bacterium]